MFDLVEMSTYFFYTAGVANYDNGIGEFVGPYIQMINGAAIINDEF